VKKAGGTGSGLNDANAWSFSKLNATALRSGDVVLFKRGDVFYGTLTVKASGLNQPISYGTYGTGNDPVITGFKELTSWKKYSGNIYYATLDVPTLNIVTLNGVIKGQGRYPNTGYLPYTSHLGNMSISGKSIGSLPFNPAGAEVVIRKQRWILDRHTIVSRLNNTITYLLSNNYGNNTIYSPYDGNGYFIQGHLKTLDKEGEWYYDNSANRLYMHFGSSMPTNSIVKASAIEKNLIVNYYNHVTFNNITFEGANSTGAYNVGTNNIIYNSCNFRQQGGNAIWGSYISNLQINGGTVSNALNNGIIIEQEGNNIIIDGVIVTNSGIIAGAAKSGDGSQEGIIVTGNNMTIKNSSVANSGYIGINFQGNNVLIENNFVDNFSNVKDDGAGIYTYNPGTTATNRIVRNNIILNAIGAFVGAEGFYYEAYGKAAGIYLDDRSYNTLVTGNVVAHGNWSGILLHNNGNNQVTNNLVFDFSHQLLILAESTSITRKLTIIGNTFIAKTAKQKTLQIDMAVDDNPQLMGTFNSNIYARPLDDDQTIGINKIYKGGNGLKTLSVAAWKTSYSQDSKSQKSLILISDTSNFMFEYNYSKSSLSVPLNGIWKDVKNITYTTELSVRPFGGKVLICY